MKPIQHLNDLLNKAQQEKYPGIRPELLAPYKMKAGSANELTKAVIKYIQLMGGQAERISVTGRRVDQTRIVTDVLGQKRQIGSVKWIKSSMQVGTADISATIKDKSGIGRSVKIEIKIGRDTQRPEQVEYQRQVERAGGTYLIVKDFDSFFEWYQQFTTT